MLRNNDMKLTLQSKCTSSVTPRRHHSWPCGRL